MVQIISRIRPAQWLLLLIAVVSLFGINDHSRLPGMVKPGQTENKGDLALYKHIDERVAAGENYYVAAAELHRERGYPLHPFVTVRPPIVAWTYGWLGPNGMVALAVVLIAAMSLVWNSAMAGYPLVYRAIGMALLSALGAIGIDGRLICFHELWSGLLLATALGLAKSRQFPLRLGLVVLAVAVREIALPFLLLMLAYAVWERAPRQVAAICGALAVLAVLLFWHKLAVDAVALPGDAHSQGWHGGRGVFGFAMDAALLGGFRDVWRPLAIFMALSPLAGWFAFGARDRYFAFLWFAGFALFCGLFARLDNYYWVEQLMPLYFLGWILLAADFFHHRLLSIKDPAELLVGAQ